MGCAEDRTAFKLGVWDKEQMNEGEKCGEFGARRGMGAGQVLVILGLLLVYGIGGYWLIFEVVMFS